MDAQLGATGDALNKALANAKGQGHDGTHGTPSPPAKKTKKGKGAEAMENKSPTAAKGRKRKLDDVEQAVSLLHDHYYYYYVRDLEIT